VNSGKIDLMSETSAPRDTAHVRQVTSVETLKALADPLRLAILKALMRDAQNLRVMSVKELAAELGEPQTKLYRHVKQLEAARLIRVASTRVISGMIEQRYQACQASLAFDSRIVRDPGQADEGATMVSAFLNRYLDRFLARRPEDGSQDVMRLTTATVSPATARLIREKLGEVTAALEQPLLADEVGVPVEVLLGFLSWDDSARVTQHG
jgi:DNA-binding transcriptional ArsR family regulator